ncbi:hypothetical protein AMRN_2522 [Malaciobacter marinus]|uniref:Uncharacterized protein n=1 Tax=Malaciobacter marinus TaxID=505249 RepID=A0A347TNP5_9BACT|nr:MULTISPECIES: hypothetical protein [Malaciobacter]AXX88223.1 hypothetical protein AMRN_2522 [Malaciobacter marinus]PHO13926.1 hypothetical protein CPG38_00790 [Malaciobacter marinus]PHO15755.1 hypothetical protein CPH92_05280 [Malaciobacter marinus]RYA24429.1 hypothetical protein CRU96_03010 [Malaciobacter halophilus]
MERRDWSLKALSELVYIDSLDSYDKAQALVRWNKDYLTSYKITDFDLPLEDLEKLSELFFKNIDFLKEYRKETQDELKQTQKLKEFAKNK